MEHFKKHTDAEVAIVLTNNPEAYVLQRADNFEIPTHIFDKHEFYETDNVVDLLKNLNIDLLVLAGFLWLVPDTILANYPKRIINIHPALLPNYGGKGMYGHYVHEAVKAAGDTESGITIHLVNEHYDEGKIIFQAATSLLPEDSAETIATKVLALEHRYFAEVIESLL